MKLQFYVITTTIILTFEYGKGLEGLQKERNKSKNLLMVVINSDVRDKPISRTNYDLLTKKAQIQQRRIQKAHDVRMNEVIDFMKSHIYSTVYLLKEVERIKRDRQIKDDLREMVTYLEKPDNYKQKQLVLTYFKNIKKENMKKRILNIWNKKPNDAVINVFKDPFNDGVIN